MFVKIHIWAMGTTTGTCFKDSDVNYHKFKQVNQTPFRTCGITG